jgi:hypothetical protein
MRLPFTKTAHLLDAVDVVEWIAGNREEVGILADRDRSFRSATPQASAATDVFARGLRRSSCRWKEILLTPYRKTSCGFIVVTPASVPPTILAPARCSAAVRHDGLHPFGHGGNGGVLPGSRALVIDTTARRRPSRL